MHYHSKIKVDSVNLINTLSCAISPPARVVHKPTLLAPLPPHTTTAGMAAVKSGQLLSPPRITSFYQPNTGAENKHGFITRGVDESVKMFMVILICGQ